MVNCHATQHVNKNRKIHAFGDSEKRCSSNYAIMQLCILQFRKHGLLMYLQTCKISKNLVKSHNKEEKRPTENKIEI